MLFYYLLILYLKNAFHIPGNMTVPIPTKDDPKATILSLCRRLLNSPKKVYTTAVDPPVLKDKSVLIICNYTLL